MSEMTYLEGLFKNGAHRSNYLCHWSEYFSYLYVETPKVACTTIKRVLQAAESEVTGRPLADNIHDRETSPLLRVSEAAEAFKKVYQNPTTFKFCFVRNPYSRILSCYLDKFVENEWERRRLAPSLGFNPKNIPTFLEFLTAVYQQDDHERDIHWSTQTFLLRPNRIRYDYVGRFENFGAQFETVYRHLKLPSGLLKDHRSHATNASEKVSEHFSTAEIDMVRKIYKMDFENFGYGYGTRLI